MLKKNPISNVPGRDTGFASLSATRVTGETARAKRDGIHGKTAVIERNRSVGRQEQRLEACRTRRRSNGHRYNFAVDLYHRIFWIESSRAPASNIHKSLLGVAGKDVSRVKVVVIYRLDSLDLHKSGKIGDGPL